MRKRCLLVKRRVRRTSKRMNMVKSIIPFSVEITRIKSRRYSSRQKLK
jgi:hypothetical protein